MRLSSFVQFFNNLRADLSDTLSTYLNDTALLSLFLDPAYKPMSDFGDDLRRKAEQIFRQAMATLFPQPEALLPTAESFSIFESEFDSPTISSIADESMVLL